MSAFQTLQLPAGRMEPAPDGSGVRVLLRVAAGGMAHFELAAGTVSRAVVHRSVDEIWYVVSGSGEMWRRQGEREEVTVLRPGVCLTIPVGTHFQFRAAVHEGVGAIGVTMPPWPGDAEAAIVPGPWKAGNAPAE